jgi:SRSO17 transposase
LELADLDTSDYDSEQSGLWTRGLLIRRNIADGDLVYFSTWCPAGTTIETLVAVEGHRWAVEDGFEIAKGELGLDHNETRSWHGWHRHVSLVMLAFAMLATIRHRANRGREKNPPPTIPKRIQSLGSLVRAGNSPYRHPSGATAH